MSQCRGFQFKRLQVIGALVGLLSLGGCSDFFGPKAEGPRPIEMSESSQACLKGLGENLSSWVENGDSDVGESIDCVVKAMDTFTDRTRGSAEGSYSRVELAKFISTYLAKAGSFNGADPSSWTQAAMRVKQVIFGGSDERVSREEITRIRGFLLRSKPLLKQLTPGLGLAIFRSKTSSGTKATQAAQTVEGITQLLAEEIEKTTSQRPVAHLRGIAASVQKLGLDDGTLEQWIPVVEAVKAIVVGGDKQRILPYEWSRLMRASGRIWSLAIRTKYDLLPSADVRGLDIDRLDLAIDDSLRLLEEAASYSERREVGIELARFEDLIDALAAKSLVPKTVSAAALKGILPAVFSKILYGVSKPDAKAKERGLGPSQLMILRDAARDWIAGQRDLIEALGTHRDLPANELSVALDANGNEGETVIPRTLGPADRAQSQLVKLLAQGRPLAHDKDNRLLVQNDAPALNRDDLDLLNAARVVVTLVLRGYASNAQMANDLSGLTEKEVQDAYLDFRDIGRELGLIDKRNVTAGKRTFMEASIFTSMSDGDARVSLHEMVEWFQTVLSGGTLADRIHHQMVRECGIKSVDVFGKKKLEIGCFRRRFLAEFAEHFSNLPGLVAWYRADRTGKRAQDFEMALERAGRPLGHSDQPVDSAELRSMIPILHYTESIFVRRDLDKNQILDAKEIWDAFPLMQPFILALSKGKADSEFLQKAIFSYLIVFGEPPALNTLGYLKVGGWSLGRYLWREDADRLDVLKVISSVVISGKQSRRQRISEYYEKSGERMRTLLEKQDQDEILQWTELFQCLPEAAPILAELLKRNVDLLTPRNQPLDTDAFISKFKVVIQSEPRLESICLPF